MSLYSGAERAQAKEIAANIRDLSAARKYHVLHKRLKKLGFKPIDSGCFKVVYASHKYPTLVLKIFRSGTNKDCPVHQLTKGAKRYYLTPIWSFKRFIIQKKFDEKKPRKNSVSAATVLLRTRIRLPNDISEDHNVCFHDGKPYFYDFC